MFPQLPGLHDIKNSKRGRPAVEGDAVTVRMVAVILKAIDDWRRNQDDLPGRPESHSPAFKSGVEGEV